MLLMLYREDHATGRCEHSLQDLDVQRSDSCDDYVNGTSTNHSSIILVLFTHESRVLSLYSSILFYSMLL